ncbi:MAG: methylmalonyl Co-A mutase-associated GTPase MeaB, partial [Planctomycetes bacterium]|nr:methylmalonyl Co-A mutase-associated GTPase MeaB [Planctomycetota bacterium]
LSTPNPSLADRLLDGQRGALARALTWAEDADARFPALLEKVYGRVGQGRRLGVTGPPGAGKSTLVNQLTRHLRQQERTVGVLAVDPSSPFTGGALLGDRIRMEDRTMDPGVFIRSMASRGSRGGLARATVDAFDVMDAFGLEDLIVETVGVGQAEYDVVGVADTVLVVLCPGAGDGVQAMKSGLLEVAHVLCVNKSDRPGADRMLADLSEAVHIRTAGKGVWTPPVVSASAGTDKGVDDVLEAIADHRAYMAQEGRLEERRKQQRLEQVQRVLREGFDDEIWARRGLVDYAASMIEASTTTHGAAERILEELLQSLPAGWTEKQ